MRDCFIIILKCNAINEKSYPLLVRITFHKGDLQLLQLLNFDVLVEVCISIIIFFALEKSLMEKWELHTIQLNQFHRKSIISISHNYKVLL